MCRTLQVTRMAIVLTGLPLSILSVGCTTTMRIDVERVNVDTEVETRDRFSQDSDADSIAAAKVEATRTQQQEYLVQMLGVMDEVEKLDEIVQSEFSSVAAGTCPDFVSAYMPEFQSKFEATLDSNLRPLVERAAELLKRVAATRAEDSTLDGEVLGFFVSSKSAIDRVSGFVRASITPALTNLKTDLQTVEDAAPEEYDEFSDRIIKMQLNVTACRDNAVQAVSRIEARLPQVEMPKLAASQIVNSSTRSNSPFGGLHSVGTHQIRPGHPMYKKILASEQVADEPFSTVSATVSGKSTIMFVQEQPTQFRVHYVDMDATQMLKNVADLSAKVMDAWTKYMTGGVAVP